MKTGRPRTHTPHPDHIRHLLHRIFVLGRRYERERSYWVHRSLAVYFCRRAREDKMTITAQFTKPEDVEVTISATMTIGEWRLIHSALSSGNDRGAHLNQRLSAAIIRAVRVVTSKATEGINSE